MKKFFFILCLPTLFLGCGHAPKPEEEVRMYTAEEVDEKLSEIKADMMQTAGLFATEFEALRRVNAEQWEAIALCRKNITELDIPGDVTFCGIRVPTETPDGRMRFEQELFFLFVRQDYLILYMLRANQWFPDVERLLAEAGMSEDLKYVPVGESGLRANARSAARAQGWWQFVKSTGNRYGLVANSDIDMRNNLIASTKGAILYFQDLLQRFDGDTALALAGYNMGEYGLTRDIRDQGTSDYFELDLPQETAQYFFRLAALKYALEHPRVFGVDPERVNYWEPFAYDTLTVRVRYQLPLRDLVSWTGSTMREIKRLNPEVKVAWPQGTYLIHLPLGTRERVSDELDQLHNKR